MSTLVAFHAHPDDESLSMGGTLARASAEGHRVVVVVATNGDHGEKPEGSTVEQLVQTRKSEMEASCKVLGVHQLYWLGYADSGMTGWEQNTAPEAFINANTETAAQQLATILQQEQADVFTTYDWHGNYGHPDHLKVHHVGHRAAQLANINNVYEMTMNRDHWRHLMQFAPEGTEDFNPDAPADDGNPMGEPEANISHQVDVAQYCDLKRQAIKCHASQISDTGFLGNLTPEMFQMSFGLEWFIKVGESGPPCPAWLFD
jgi:LmbE family N-acetylglucosaminyl deacetylase